MQREGFALATDLEDHKRKDPKVVHGLYKLTGAQGPQGPQGDQGTTGDQGSQGDVGDQGPQGYQGYQGDQGVIGPQGYQGYQGPQGPQGLIGPQGNVGEQGEAGPQGNQGFQGDIGAQGVQGTQGEIGEQGETGSTGAQGTQGFQGDVGATGSQGPQGDIGEQGETGSTGAQGTQGDQGDTGATGSQGPQGNVGAQGDEGSQGTQGFQGPDGAQGVQGSQGFMGEQGPTGEPGLDINWEGQWLTSTLYHVNDSVENNDSSYICILEHTSGAASEPGVGGSWETYWDPLAIKGEQGEQGAPGPQGVQGTQGYMGEQGPIGNQGAQGFQGDIGAQGVTGSQGAVGEQGETGSTGAQGAQGDQGDTGSTGSQGPQGDIGEQGETGSTGAQGAQGFQGDEGVQGAVGPQGSVGDQGAPGPQGNQGYQGYLGEQGAQGSQGYMGSQGPEGVSGYGVERFEEIFDGLNTGDIDGQGDYLFTSSWDNQSDANCSAEVAVKSGADKMLRLYDNTAAGRAYAGLTIDSGHELIIANFQCKIRQSHVTTQSFIRFQRPGQTTMEIRIWSDGKIKIFNGTSVTDIQSYVANTFYTIRLHFDSLSKAVAIFVDNVYKLQVALPNADYVKSITFETVIGSAGGFTFDIDDVKWANFSLTEFGGAGPQGPQGHQGYQGYQGSTGPQGSTGAQGPTGSQGPIGSQGPRGYQGYQGVTGAQGPQGYQGIPGGGTPDPHAASHLVSGSDPLSVGTPVNISTANSAGTATNFVRRDHVHAHPSGLGVNLHHAQLHEAQHEVGGNDLVHHDSLTGFVSNEHINHANVIMTAGSGLSGGGSIVASRTFNLGTLTGNWDAGSYQIRALKFYSDQATGVAPFTVLSTTKVTNLNADLLEGYHASSVAGNNTIVLRTSSGYIYCNYLNCTSGETTSEPTHYFVETGNDSFLRQMTPANFVAKLAADGLMPKSGGAFTSHVYAADHGTASVDMVVNVCYGTGNPPAANTTTIGTLFIKYTP